jgi:hypothetical protein
VLALGDAVATTAAMTCWVAFSFFFLGQDSLSTVQSSIKVVALALYNSGTAPENSFMVVSNYLLASCLAAVILVSVGSVFWIVSVFTSRPNLLQTMRQFLFSLSECAETSVKVLSCLFFLCFFVKKKRKQRFDNILHPVSIVGSLEKNLSLIAALESESDAEPVLFASPIPKSGQLFQLFSSMLVIARGLDEASFAASQHLKELEEFKVLNQQCRSSLAKVQTGEGKLGVKSSSYLSRICCTFGNLRGTDFFGRSSTPCSDFWIWWGGRSAKATCQSAAISCGNFFFGSSLVLSLFLHFRFRRLL